MSITKIQTLIGVELLEISNNFLFEMRQKYQDKRDVFEYLPKYTINNNEDANKELIDASYYLQFTGFGVDEKNEKYLFVNIKTIDNDLEEEISNSGVEYLFENLDFKKILSNFTPQTEYDYSRHQRLATHYLIVEVEHLSSYHPDYGYDYEANFDIIGYLDNKMNKILFTNNKN